MRPKNNKIPEFYMIFARKMSEYYIIIARKIFSRDFWGTRAPSYPGPVESLYLPPQLSSGWAVILTWRRQDSAFIRHSLAYVFPSEPHTDHLQSLTRQSVSHSVTLFVYIKHPVCTKIRLFEIQNWFLLWKGRGTAPSPRYHPQWERGVGLYSLLAPTPVDATASPLPIC